MENKLKNRFKKIVTPKALVINIIWLSLLLVGGFFVIKEIKKEKLGIINDPNKVRLIHKLPINGKIETLTSNRGFTYVKLDNNKIISIEPSRNENYKNPWLDDFLQIDDYLKKEENSDTLKIKRDNQIFYFVIGKFINKE